MVKGKLLFHPIPFKHESITNYFFRLSQANRCRVEWLLNEFGLNTEYTINGLNGLIDGRKIKEIAFATGLSPQIVREMTFLKYSSPNSTIDDLSDFIYLDGSGFCPLCLQENIYHRLFWQIKNLNICTHHSTYLAYKCLKCLRNITPMKVAKGKCTCGRLLIEELPFFCKDSDLIEINNKLHNSLGIIDICKYSGEAKFTKDMYIRLFCILFQFAYDNYHYVDPNSMAERSACMIYTDQLLSNWPRLLNTLINRIADSEEKPKWLQNGYDDLFGLYQIIYRELLKYTHNQEIKIFLGKLLFGFYEEKGT